MSWSSKPATTMPSALGKSIPPDTGLMFRSLGIWDDFVAEEHAPCLGRRSAWGENRLGYNDYLYNPHGQGWHLDRQRFDAFLLTQTASGGWMFVTRNRFRQGGTAVRRRLSSSFDWGRWCRYDAHGPIRRRCHGCAGVCSPISYRASRRRLDQMVVEAWVSSKLPRSKGSHLTLLEAVEMAGGARGPPARPGCMSRRLPPMRRC